MSDEQKYFEKEFLKMVKAYRSIGYGRMMQIISYEWHKHDSDGALTIGSTVALLPEGKKRVYEAMKESDPLFQNKLPSLHN